MTEDVRPKWLNVARRCQSIACRQEGYATLTIVLLVDDGGDPVFWFEPKLDKIEPKHGGSRFIEKILSAIASKNG